MGFHSANFGLPRPSVHCWVRSSRHATDRLMRDGRTETAAHFIMPSSFRGGSIISMCSTTKFQLGACPWTPVCFSDVLDFGLTRCKYLHGPWLCQTDRETGQNQASCVGDVVMQYTWLTTVLHDAGYYYCTTNNLNNLMVIICVVSECSDCRYQVTCCNKCIKLTCPSFVSISPLVIICAVHVFCRYVRAHVLFTYTSTAMDWHFRKFAFVLLRKL